MHVHHSCTACVLATWINIARCCPAGARVPCVLCQPCRFMQGLVINAMHSSTTSLRRKSLYILTTPTTQPRPKPASLDASPPPTNPSTASKPWAGGYSIPHAVYAPQTMCLLSACSDHWAACSYTARCTLLPLSTAHTQHPTPSRAACARTCCSPRQCQRQQQRALRRPPQLLPRSRLRSTGRCCRRAHQAPQTLLC